jgi:ATP-dependent protease ClpP protease subunit
MGADIRRPFICSGLPDRRNREDQRRTTFGSPAGANRLAPSAPKECRGSRAAASNPARVSPIIVATLLLFAFALQCVDLRAELLFRSGEQKNGKQMWSALKNYGNPSDIVYPRTRADGTLVPAEEVQVFLQGYISSEDVHAEKVMEDLIKNGSQKIAGNIVSLASNGGEVDAAMELGRLLRKLGVSTVVAQGENCLSSCVFAFMGGDKRTVAGSLGIHRPYFSSTREVPDRRIYYRQLQKKLQEYIDELDFPQSLYEAVMAIPPESVSVLAPAELKRYYLEGMSPSTQDEVDATSARAQGISVLEYLQRKATENGNAPYDPGGQQKDQAAPGARATASVAGQTHAKTESLGASRGAIGSPRASF